MSNGPIQPCTNVGQPGNDVQLPFPLPDNVLCSLTGYTQTGSTITVAVVSNSTQKAAATISGTGTSPTAMIDPVSQTPVATFNSGTDTFYLTVTSVSSGVQNPPASVIIQNLDLTYSTTAYGGVYALIAEDDPASGDCDFNDCTCFLAWNLFSG